MSSPSGWGPGHNIAPPVRFGPEGRYWWGIAAGAVISAPHTWRVTHGDMGDDGPALWLGVVVMVGAALCVGVGEAKRGKRFASGRWIAWSIASLAVLASCWGLPALAYLGGYYGWPRYLRWRAIQSACPAAAPAPARPAVTAAEAAPPAAVALPSVAGGYLGVDEHGRAVAASPRGATLVVGPPGSGKTQSVVMPSVAYAPAACVSTSMKAEVLAATSAARATRGRVWLFDPGGGTPPAGVIGLRWSPLCDVTSWDAARSVAARLTGPARAAAGASHSGDHWTDRAETWLSVLLFAAKLAAPGGDVRALARWCMNPTAAGPETEALLIVAEQDGIDGADIAAALLGSLLGVPDRERESIASTLGRLMNIYTSSAALRVGESPNFDPAAFVRGADTVYITAPVDRQRDYAPLIAAFLESIRLAQYHRRQSVDLGTETQSQPVTFVLDEAANTAPIPLSNIVSEAGGQGLHLVVAFQDLSQARARWGREAADGFLTLFPEKLILSGMADRDTADMLSKMSGEYDRMTVAASHSSTVARRWADGGRSEGYSYSTHRTPVLSVADITGVPAGRGLHWSPSGWRLLTLNPWHRQRQAYGL